MTQRLVIRLADYIAYVLIAGAVWLAWEIVKAPVAVRGGPALAVRAAPYSPETLRRAAEAELAAGRAENAAVLASESLARAPFNARALRVLGLSADRLGRPEQADQLLTLAGNWSLRDDPAHAWLIQQRLRQGSYSSAFAHADTLARRRTDGQGGVFKFFATAALADTRATPVLARLLAPHPPWRTEFLLYLIENPDGDVLLLNLGLLLGDDASGYTNQELSRIYLSWFNEGRLDAIRVLRAELRRPPQVNDLQDGDFDVPADEGLQPFAWRIEPRPGIMGVMTFDDIRTDDMTLRVEYDGFASGNVAEQTLMLQPGTYVLAGQERVEESPETPRLGWSISCIENGTIVMNIPSGVNRESREWTKFERGFRVPETMCSIQRLSLDTEPGERRTPTTISFDKLRISLSRDAS